MMRTHTRLYLPSFLLTLSLSLLLVACEKAEPLALEAESPSKAQVLTEESQSKVAKDLKAKSAPKNAPQVVPIRPPSDVSQQLIITDPEKGSPEALVQAFLMGAMDPDESAGWERVKGLLHSKMVTTPMALQSYRKMNFPASRRKVKLFTPDDSKPHFLVTRTIVRAEDRVTIFVHNEKSMPTPCTLRRDAKADNAWRIYKCSL